MSSITQVEEEHAALLPSSHTHGQVPPKEPQVNRNMLLRLITLIFLTTFAYYHLLAPKLRLIELEICREHYLEWAPGNVVQQSYWPGYSVEEHLCKVKPVQSRVSDIRTISVFIEGLITVLLSIPYGYMADRYGRKLVYQLGILGLALSTLVFLAVCTAYDSLPVETILVASGFLAIGGGTSVLLALAVTIGSDISPEEHRSTVLYWILGTYYLATVSASSLVLATMTGLLLPFVLALLSLALAYAFTVDLQDTRRTPLDEAQIPTGVNRRLPKDSMLQRAREKMFSAAAFARRNWKLVLAVLLFPLMASRGPMIELALPYVSTRYDWSLRQAAILDAINASIALVFAAVILPFTLKLLRRLTGSAFLADGIVAMYSSSAICLGAIIAGAASHINVMILGWVVYSAGCGVRMAVVALATSLTPATYFARLNTVIITVEMVADLTLSPLIWQAWRVGLNAGGALMGLPWFIVASTMVIVFMAQIPLICTGNVLDSKASSEEAEGQT